MREYIEKFLKEKAFQYKEIDSIEIPFFEEMVKYCIQNKCGKYNTNWTCPPAVGNFYELKESYLKYSKALVYTIVYKLSDAFDIEGMNEARKKNISLCDNIINSLKNKGYDFSVMKAGSCEKCKKCTYPDFPCRHKDITFPSLEATGVDVAALAKKLEMKYYNGENTVTYFTIFFYD